MHVERLVVRREAYGRRGMADRRDVQRRAHHRRVGGRRTSLMVVSRERRELSDRRMLSRRDGRDRRSGGERRLGARRTWQRRASEHGGPLGSPAPETR